MAQFNLEDYETVEDRLVKFWEKFPAGRVETFLIDRSETQFIVGANIYRVAEDEMPFSMGMAQETVGVGMVNKTSALENCETSAIGRALANGGFATRGKRASREEMQKVERGTKEIKTAKPKLSESEINDSLTAAYVEVGLAGSADELKKIWARNADFLDVDLQETTLRAYILQRKDEMK